MNKLKNNARPTSTWFGGMVCNPSAFRVSDKTTTIFVKLVHSINAAGANEITVIIKMMTIDWLGLPFTPLIETLTVELLGVLGLVGPAGPLGSFAPAAPLVALLSPAVPEAADDDAGAIGAIGVIGAIDALGLTIGVGAAAIASGEPKTATLVSHALTPIAATAAALRRIRSGLTPRLPMEQWKERLV